MGRHYNPEHDDPDQNVDDYLADQHDPKSEDMDERLKELEIESLWKQHKKAALALLPQPGFEEIEGLEEFERLEGQILCHREDFRELVKMRLAPKKS